MASSHRLRQCFEVVLPWPLAKNKLILHIGIKFRNHPKDGVKTIIASAATVILEFVHCRAAGRPTKTLKAK